jgi:hypothetical protein
LKVYSITLLLICKPNFTIKFKKPTKGIASQAQKSGRLPDAGCQLLAQNVWALRNRFFCHRGHFCFLNYWDPKDTIISHRGHRGHRVKKSYWNPKETIRGIEKKENVMPKNLRQLLTLTLTLTLKLFQHQKSVLHYSYHYSVYSLPLSKGGCTPI